MKIKRDTILRLLLIMVIAISATPDVASKPALASPSVLKWTRLDTPGSLPGKNDIASPCEVNLIRIGADGKTFYAVNIASPDNVTGGKAIYKSTDGGISWSDTISRNLFNAMSSAERNKFRVWNVAIAPDDVKLIAAVTNDSITTRPRNVWISIDGGGTWENTNCPAGDDISVIDISPNRHGHDVAIGTRTGMGNGDIYIFKTSGQGEWATQGFSSDVLAMKFSPNYESDSTLIVVASNNSGTYINLGIHDKVANSTNWDTWGPVEITTAGANTSPTINEIITADLGLPSDFSAHAPSLRRFYISLDDGGATGNAGIYRFDNTTGYKLMAATLTKRISSIAYYGTYASGKLLAGEVLGNPCSATVITWFTDAPTACPIPCWYPAMKPPTGAAGANALGYGNAQVAWAPDGTIAYAGTSTTGALVPGTDWPIPYLTGKDLDESAFSISRNNGETWNQLALIDTKIDQLVDIAPSPDCSTVYLASVNKNASLSGFDSVWRLSQNTAVVAPLPAAQMVIFWERVLCQPTSSHICAADQTDNAILMLSGNSSAGQLVFWAAVGTKKLMWSPDFGDYWADISSGITVQDMAPEDSQTLYVLSPDGWVQKFTHGGSSWLPLNAVYSGLDTGYSIATAYTSLTPDNDKGHIIVGGAGTGIYDVAYSTDGGNSFTAITTPLPTRGKTLVIAHSSYKSGGNIFAINSGGMYEWSIYYGGGTWAWPLPEPDEWSTQWGGLDWPTSVTSLSISRNGGFYFCDAWGAYIRWSWAAAGLPFISFGAEPTRRCRICGGLELGEPVTVWVIDQQPYNPPQGGVWCYTDCLLWNGPTPLEPISKASVDCDPGSGRAGQINLRWEPVCLSQGYRIEIAKDEDFALKIAEIGGYAEMEPFYAPSSLTTKVTASGGGPPYYPPDPDAPALSIPAGGGIVRDSKGNRWNIPPLEAGHTYYWRVSVRDVATGDAISSPLSWREMFTVNAGLQVAATYYGPQLLTPDNGHLGCPVEGTLFSWSPFRETTKYKFVLAKDATMHNLIVEAEVPTTAYKYEGSLDYGTDYFWRVRALEPIQSDWSPIFVFRTEDAPTPLPSPSQRVNRFVWVIIAIGVLLDICLLILIMRRRTG